MFATLAHNRRILEIQLKMNSLLPIFLLTVLAAAVIKAQEGELIIEVIYLPTNCPIKSQNGDILTTDYTGYLVNGTVFDTR